LTQENETLQLRFFTRYILSSVHSVTSSISGIENSLHFFTGFWCSSCADHMFSN